MIWYENNKKYTKEELKQIGKDFTECFILLIIAAMVLGIISCVATSFFPAFIFVIFMTLITFFYLNRLRAEWYERFCK